MKVSFEFTVQEFAEFRNFMAQNALENAMEDAIQRQMEQEDEEVEETLSTVITDDHISIAARELGISASEIRNFLHSKGIVTFEDFLQSDVPTEYKERIQRFL